MDKYFATPATVRDILKTYGVAIIPNVLDEQESNAIIEGIWDFFEHITQQWPVPLDRDNTETWASFYDLFPLHSMLIQYHGVGHAQVSWDVRQNPKVANIFAKIYGVEAEDLLVSFDGLSFNLPPEVTGRGWNRGNTWYHSDQSFTRNDFETVQGWVTGLDVEKDDATLAFLESSHKYHAEFRHHFGIEEKDDWYKLNTDQLKWYIEKGCLENKITCPKGSLVLWDSRTIHCGVEACKTRENPKFRAVIYVSYDIKDICPDLEKKQKAFEELRTTTHNASQVKLFGKHPRTYGKKIPPMTPPDPPVLTELGESLAGF